MVDDGVSVTVKGAKKRDAGRGIARLPESVRNRLGVLSGDPVRIEGDRETVAKVWPEDGNGEYVRIDADTRSNADVTVGSDVTLRRASLRDAEAVDLRPIDGTVQGSAESTIEDRLGNTPVGPGDRVTVPEIGTFHVEDTDPDGTVRVVGGTTIAVGQPMDDPESGDDGADASTDEGEPGSITYEDIGGLDDELDRVREMIELPLSDPDVFDRLGIDPPKGVLLYGPPGTGKTLIARAVANEVDAYFESISGPEIVSKYKGESEQQLREAFERAESEAPSILFVDEIDSIAGARDEDSDMENRVVAQLLTLLDGLESRGQVIVIGATNRVDAVDPALRRGGRFDREIEVGVPDREGREEILEVHTRGVPLADDVDLDRLAGRMHGFVGADVASVVTEAAMAALQRERDEPVVSRADFEQALAGVEPSAMRAYVAESPAVDFADVGGLDEVKDTLREAVEWPLEYGPLFEATDTEPPTGVLLYGPPGTGKTLLARALAGETDVNFIRVAGPELLDRYVGESEKAVRELFERARQTAPTIVFLDEIDAIAARRGEGHEVTERVVSQLLTELDAAGDDPNLVVVAATNRRDALDDALLRPGRLETHVEVPAPDRDARQAVLDVHTAAKPLGPNVDVEGIAAETEGFSGADLDAVVRAASMRAIRRVAADRDPAVANERTDEVTIQNEDFAAARDRIEPSLL
ncbi:Cell division cycle protein [Halorhabdus tiamatea SARL4B]|uniref:Cell division cycle protein n=1 Tax=Halorhabdus tiamatea SARL4B TaxID=1033806 RepID=F7PHS9_9EURY|nr:AAA family ATPase [Halorhabdus tiamatea]ERJ06923.1 Cell division cycle protein [Halorhabdus tiamatea SARL4B]CCQ32375.1 cell division protein FtsH [Halorhabdus tiamatea SARL4B]